MLVLWPSFFSPSSSHIPSLIPSHPLPHPLPIFSLTHSSQSVSPFEKQIQRDLTRTFPEHDFFRNGPGQEALQNVLKVRYHQADVWWVSYVHTYTCDCIHKFMCSQCLCCRVCMYVCIAFSPVCTYVQAYSVYDREVGYCQGSPFIAGVLLLHVRGGGGRGGEVL